MHGRLVSTELDALDRQIIDALRVDARLSARALGRRLGVAAGTVGQRVSRLEQAGVIRGYTAVVEPASVGRPLGFVVSARLSERSPVSTAPRTFFIAIFSMMLVLLISD